MKTFGTASSLSRQFSSSPSLKVSTFQRASSTIAYSLFIGMMNVLVQACRHNADEELFMSDLFMYDGL
jgi:hypothetical protein